MSVRSRGGPVAPPAARGVAGAAHLAATRRIGTASPATSSSRAARISPAAVVLGLAAAGAALLALPAAASPQEVRGTVVRQDSGAPVEGGIVTLVGEGGREVASALTDGEGAFRVEAPGAGRYVLRLERIGLRSWSSEPLELAAGRILTRRVEAPVEPVALDEIRVEADGRCEVDPAGGIAAALLWEEARKALKATAVGERERSVRYRVRRFERRLALDLAVEEERIATRSDASGKAFESLPIGEVAERGWVRETGDGERRTYFAPDAEALLSDAFSETHCFRVAAADEALWSVPGGSLGRGGEDGDGGTGEAEGGGDQGGPGEDAAAGPRDLVGLAFEPVDRERPDLEGVLWIDRETAELDHLEYRYANLRLGPGIDDSRIGGRVDFRRLPGGEWIVRDWWIRMPRFRDRRVEGRARLGDGLVLEGYRLEGGQVLEARGREARAAAAGGPIVTGFVYDSVRGGPLAGATVEAAGSEVSATTDEAGRFRLEGLDPGPWKLTVRHRQYRLVGLESYRDVVLQPGQSVLVSFRLPSAATLMRLRCEEGRRGPAAVVGFIRRAEDDAPVSDAKVTIDWEGGGIEVRSGADGWYRACDLPAEAPLAVAAEWEGGRRQAADVPPIPREGLRKLDFAF